MARFFPRRVIDKILATQAKLRSDEFQNLHRDDLARGQSPPRIPQHAQLQCEAEFIVGPPTLSDMAKILIAEGVMLEKFRLIDRQAQERVSLSIR